MPFILDGVTYEHVPNTDTATHSPRADASPGIKDHFTSSGDLPQITAIDAEWTAAPRSLYEHLTALYRMGRAFSVECPPLWGTEVVLHPLDQTGTRFRTEMGAVSGDVTVILDGTPQASSSYTLDRTTGEVVFTSPVGAGCAPIMIAGVRFSAVMVDLRSSPLAQTFMGDGAAEPYVYSIRATFRMVDTSITRYPGRSLHRIPAVPESLPAEIPGGQTWTVDVSATSGIDSGEPCDDERRFTLEWESFDVPVPAVVRQVDVSITPSAESSGVVTVECVVPDIQWADADTGLGDPAEFELFAANETGVDGPYISVDWKKLAGFAAPWEAWEKEEDLDDDSEHEGILNLVRVSALSSRASCDEPDNTIEVEGVAASTQIFDGTLHTLPPGMFGAGEGFTPQAGAAVQVPEDTADSAIVVSSGSEAFSHVNAYSRSTVRGTPVIRVLGLPSGDVDAVIRVRCEAEAAGQTTSCGLSFSTTTSTANPLSEQIDVSVTLEQASPGVHLGTLPYLDLYAEARHSDGEVSTVASASFELLSLGPTPQDPTLTAAATLTLVIPDDVRLAPEESSIGEWVSSTWTTADTDLPLLGAEEIVSAGDGIHGVRLHGWASAPDIGQLVGVRVRFQYRRAGDDDVPLTVQWGANPTGAAPAGWAGVTATDEWQTLDRTIMFPAFMWEGDGYVSDIADSTKSLWITSSSGYFALRDIDLRVLGVELL